MIISRYVKAGLGSFLIRLHFIKADHETLLKTEISVKVQGGSISPIRQELMAQCASLFPPGSDLPQQSGPQALTAVMLSNHHVLDQNTVSTGRRGDDQLARHHPHKIPIVFSDKDDISASIRQKKPQTGDLVCGIGDKVRFESEEACQQLRQSLDVTGFSFPYQGFHCFFRQAERTGRRERMA